MAKKPNELSEDFDDNFSPPSKDKTKKEKKEKDMAVDPVKVCEDIKAKVKEIVDELSNSTLQTNCKAGKTLNDMLAGRVAMDEENLQLLKKGFALGEINGKRMVTNAILAIIHQANLDDQNSGGPVPAEA